MVSRQWDDSGPWGTPGRGSSSGSLPVTKRMVATSSSHARWILTKPCIGRTLQEAILVLHSMWDDSWMFCVSPRDFLACLDTSCINFSSQVPCNHPLGHSEWRRRLPRSTPGPESSHSVQKPSRNPELCWIFFGGPGFFSQYGDAHNTRLVILAPSPQTHQQCRPGRPGPVFVHSTMPNSKNTMFRRREYFFCLSAFQGYDRFADKYFTRGLFNRNVIIILFSIFWFFSWKNITVSSRKVWFSSSRRRKRFIFGKNVKISW